MPIAKFQLPDGRIGRFEVPEGTTADQAQALISQHLKDNPDLPTSPSITQPTPPEPSLTSRIGSTLGEAGRMGMGSIIRGIGGFPALLEQGAAGAYNLGAGALGAPKIAPQNMPLNVLNQTASFYDKGQQTYGGQAAEGAIGALTGTGLAKGGAQLVTHPTVQRVLQTLSEKPAQQALSGATGGAAGHAAQQAGAGPIGQFIASLFGGGIPSIPGLAKIPIQKALGGGAAAASKIKANIEQFGKAGTTPSVGQATEARAPRAIESFFSKVPGGAGPMSKAAETQRENIARQAESIADRLSSATSATQAGEILQKGLTGPGGFVERFQRSQKILYDQVDKYIQPNQEVSVQNYRGALDRLTKVTPGAEATTAGLKNAKIKELYDRLLHDLNQHPSQGKQVVGATGQTKTVFGGAKETLPYSTIKAVRSDVGAMLDASEMISGAPRAQLKQLYAALSQDMENAARATGNPEAIKAVQSANNFTRIGHERIDSVLQGLMDKKTPEEAFTAATEVGDKKGGATKLKVIMQSLRPDEQDALRSVFVRRMGKQREDGEFSTNVFLNRWQSMPANAKNAMFNGSRYDQMRTDLDAIAKTAKNIQEGSKVFANPSGTTPAATMIGGVAAAGSAMAAGNWHTAGGILASMVALNKGAKLMTNPDFVHWLATELKHPDAPISAEAANAIQIEMRDGESK